MLPENHSMFYFAENLLNSEITLGPDYNFHFWFDERGFTNIRFDDDCTSDESDEIDMSAFEACAFKSM